MKENNNLTLPAAVTERRTRKKIFAGPFAEKVSEDDLDYDPCDNVLAAPLGNIEMCERISNCGWLPGHIKETWPGRSTSPYVNAYATMARLVTAAGALRCSHPYDLAFAVMAPRWFALFVKLVLGDRLEEVAKDSTGLFVEPVNLGNVRSFVTDLLQEFATKDESLIYALKVLGYSIYDSVI